MKKIATCIGFMILGALLVVSATVPAAIISPEITEWWSNLGKFGTALIENPFLITLFIAGIVFIALGVATAIVAMVREGYLVGGAEYLDDREYVDEYEEYAEIHPDQMYAEEEQDMHTEGVAEAYEEEEPEEIYEQDYTEAYTPEGYPTDDEPVAEEDYIGAQDYIEDTAEMNFATQEDAQEDQDYSATISRGTVARREFKPKQFEELDLDKLNEMDIEEGQFEEVEVDELGRFEEVELGDLEIERKEQEDDQE